MTLADLTVHGAQELGKFRRKEPSDDSYSLEIFRRALVEHNEAAWAVLHCLFSENIRLWLRRHQYKEAALRLESEQSYVDEAFRRFWQWTCNQKLEFTSVAGALSALHLCLNSAVMDTLRAYCRPKEEPMPEGSRWNEGRLTTEDSYHESELWTVIASVLPNKRELRVIYLIYHCGLKPKEMLLRCPGEFADEQEIYRLTRNALDRLRRKCEYLRWRLDEN